MLVRITGDLDVGKVVDHLMETLGNVGFLHNEVYDELRHARHRE